jgi:hypothetical protein
MNICGEQKGFPDYRSEGRQKGAELELAARAALLSDTSSPEKEA